MIGNNMSLPALSANNILGNINRSIVSMRDEIVLLYYVATSFGAPVQGRY